VSRVSLQVLMFVSHLLISHCTQISTDSEANRSIRRTRFYSRTSEFLHPSDVVLSEDSFILTVKPSPENPITTSTLSLGISNLVRRTASSSESGRRWIRTTSLLLWRARKRVNRNCQEVTFDRYCYIESNPRSQLPMKNVYRVYRNLSLRWTMTSL
jgi:hypothetical protein